MRPKLVVDYTAGGGGPTAVTLNAPTNVQTTQMSLSWSQNNDANFQSYKLYRSTTAGVTEASTLVTTINTQATTSYTDTGLTGNTAYYYKVYVVNTSNATAGSNEVNATTTVPPPTAVTLNNPTNVQSNQMTLTWSQNNDANFQSYKLYRSNTAGVTTASTLVTTQNQQSTTTFTDTGLNANTTYYYKLYVTNMGGVSAGSNEVSATTLQPSSPPTAVTLNAPTNLQQTQMTLTWSQNADGSFQSYKLYRSTTAGVTEASTLVTTQNQQPTTAFTDTGLAPDTAYYYKVYVVNTAGVTAGSNEVSATTQQPPPPPTAVTLNNPTNVQTNQMTLTWSQNADGNFQSYKLYRSTTAGVTEASTLVTTQNQQTTTTFTDTGLATNTAYYYKVYVVNTSNVTAGSNEVTATSATANTRTIQLTADPATVPADGQSLSTLTATVTDNGQAVPDGTEVNFTTNWGTLMDSQATPPQTVQATTTNGQATATLVAADTAPAGNGTFTLSATSGGAVATLQAQAQQAAAGPGNIVVQWYPQACSGDKDKIAGVARVHVVVVSEQLGWDVESIKVSEVPIQHTGQQITWTKTDQRAVLVTYTNPNDPQIPFCAPAFNQGQTLSDLTHSDDWLTGNYHNGDWNVEVKYSFMPPPVAGHPPVINHYLAACTVTVDNLILTVKQDDEHPPLLKWFGSGDQNNRTKIAFSLHSEDGFATTATIQVYPLGRSDTTSPIRTYTILTTSPNPQVDADWDGMTDDIQADTQNRYPRYLDFMLSTG